MHQNLCFKAFVNKKANAIGTTLSLTQARGKYFLGL